VLLPSLPLPSILLILLILSKFPPAFPPQRNFIACLFLFPLCSPPCEIFPAFSPKNSVNSENLVIPLLPSPSFRPLQSATRVCCAKHSPAFSPKNSVNPEKFGNSVTAFPPFRPLQSATRVCCAKHSPAFSPKNSVNSENLVIPLLPSPPSVLCSPPHECAVRNVPLPSSCIS